MEEYPGHDLFWGLRGSIAAHLHAEPGWRAVVQSDSGEIFTERVYSWAFAAEPGGAPGMRICALQRLPIELVPINEAGRPIGGVMSLVGPGEDAGKVVAALIQNGVIKVTRVPVPEAE